MKIVGLIGCGKVARVHASALRDLEGIELAFCDRNLHKAQEMAATYSSTKVYTDLDDMLAMESLDALHVLTQPASHKAIAEKALKAGCHVYVEKPITETTADYEYLTQLASGTGLMFYPGFSALGAPDVQQARHVVASGALGRLITVHCDFNATGHRGGIPYGSPDHWAYRLPGGILQNLIDHPVSLVVHLLDDVVDQSSHFLRRSELPNDVADLVHVSLVGRDQLGSVTMSFGHGNSRGILSCQLEGGTIDVDLRSHSVAVLRGSDSGARRTMATLRSLAASTTGVAKFAALRAMGRAPQSWGVEKTVQNFHAVLDGREKPLVDVARGRTVVQVLETLWDTQRT